MNNNELLAEARRTDQLASSFEIQKTEHPVKVTQEVANFMGATEDDVMEKMHEFKYMYRK